MDKEAKIKLQLEEREFNQKIREVSSKAAQAFGTLKGLERAGKVGIKVNGIEKLDALKRNYDNLNKKLKLLNDQKLKIQSGAAVGDLHKIENEIIRTKTLLAQTGKAMKNFHLPPIKPIPPSFGEKLKAFGGIVSNVGHKVNDFIGNQAQKALVGFGGVIASTIEPTAEFETGISKLGTVTGLATKENRDLGNTIKSISFKNQTNSVEALEGAYQGFSASLFSSKKDVQGLMPQLEQMSKIGFTDLSSAIDLTSTAANAFGLKGQEVNKVMDQFVQVQNKGKTTVGELAASFGKIAPAANLIKVPVNEVNAAYIQMTKNGINTAESTTRLASLFGEFAKPGKELQGAIDKAGISLTQFEKNGGTLPQYFQLLMQKTGMSVDELSKLFGTKEAMAAFSTIAKDNFSGINQAMDDVNNSSGAVKKTFDEWSNTLGGKIDNLKTNLGNFAITLGETLLPKVEGLFNWVKDLGEADINNIIDQFFKFGRAFAGIFVYSKVVSFINNTKQAFSGLGEELEKNIDVLANKGGLSAKIATVGSFLGKMFSGAVAGAITGSLVGAVAPTMLDFYGVQTSEAQQNGMLSGATYGGAIGAAVGSVIPGVGTIIGGALGSAAGATVGFAFGKSYSQEAQEKIEKTTEQISEGLKGQYASVFENIKGLSTDASRKLGEEFSNVGASIAGNLKLIDKKSTDTAQTIADGFKFGTSQTGKAFDGLVGIAASASDNLRGKVVDKMVKMTGASKEQIDDLVNKLKETGKVQAHPQINIDNQAAVKGLIEINKDLTEYEKKKHINRLEVDDTGARKKVKQASSWIEEWWKKVGGDKSQAYQLARYSSYATGGSIPALTPVSINEIGQESIRMGSQVIYPSGNSYIADQVGQSVITAEQTKRNQPGQPSNNIVFNITVNEAEDPEQTIRLIKRELRNLNL